MIRLDDAIKWLIEVEAKEDEEVQVSLHLPFLFDLPSLREVHELLLLER